jgi:hypothetical protein
VLAVCKAFDKITADKVVHAASIYSILLILFHTAVSLAWSISIKTCRRQRWEN